MVHPGWMGLCTTRRRRHKLQALSLWPHRHLRGEQQRRSWRRHRGAAETPPTEEHAPGRKRLRSPRRSGQHSCGGTGVGNTLAGGSAPLGAQRRQPSPTCPPRSESMLPHLPRSSASVLSGVRDCPRCFPALLRLRFLQLISEGVSSWKRRKASPLPTELSLEMWMVVSPWVLPETRGRKGRAGETL